jgi:hypothetical protein
MPHIIPYPIVILEKPSIKETEVIRTIKGNNKSIKNETRPLFGEITFSSAKSFDNNVIL